MTAPDVPQLCLVIDSGPTARERLLAALAAAPIASVVLRGAAGAPLDARAAKPLVELLQAKGVAALIEADARLARTLRADGVHLTWSRASHAAYDEAREILGARAIVGVDAGASRHDAMELAEAGADYIAFGIPDDAEDRSAALNARGGMVAWWSEIFEIPCVALDVDDVAEACALYSIAPDFMAITIAAGLSAAEVGNLVRAIAVTATSAAALGGTT